MGVDDRVSLNQFLPGTASREREAEFGLWEPVGQMTIMSPGSVCVKNWLNEEVQLREYICGECYSRSSWA